MNHKELLLATLKGEPTSCIPYLPRLDLWYNANALAGTLPPKYKNATLREILSRLLAAKAKRTPDTQTPDPFLRAAIEQARKGMSEGGLPIGSVRRTAQAEALRYGKPSMA